MGRFSHRVVESQNSMYVDIGRLSAKEQEQAEKLEKLQHRPEQGDSVLVQELAMFEKAIGLVDQESKAIQAEVVDRVEAEIQAQQASQQ